MAQAYLLMLIPNSIVVSWDAGGHMDQLFSFGG